MLRPQNTEINMINPYPPVAYSLGEEIGLSRSQSSVTRPRQRYLSDSGHGAGVERWLGGTF